MADAVKKNSRKKSAKSQAKAPARAENSAQRRGADSAAEDRAAIPAPSKRSGSRPSAGPPSRPAIDARRERVSKLLVAAKSTRQIADEVGASLDTVRQDIRAIRAAEKAEEPSKQTGKRPTKLSSPKRQPEPPKSSAPADLVADLERAKREGRLEVLADEALHGERIVLLRVGR